MARRNRGGRKRKSVPREVNGWMAIMPKPQSKHLVRCVQCGRDREVFAKTLYNQSIGRCKCQSLTNDPLYTRFKSVQGMVRHDPYYRDRDVSFNLKYPEFKKRVGPPPSPDARLVRINKAGDYSPDNLTWEQPITA